MRVGWQSGTSHNAVMCHDVQFGNSIGDENRIGYYMHSCVLVLKNEVPLCITWLACLNRLSLVPQNTML